MVSAINLVTSPTRRFVSAMLCTGVLALTMASIVRIRG